MNVKYIIALISFSIVVSCMQNTYTGRKEFPEFEGIEVTESTQLFFSPMRFQIYAVDLSSDKIIKTYNLEYGVHVLYNFIYVQSRKKAYFTYWGKEDILMEFDPTTGKSRRIGTQSYVNASAVFLAYMEDDILKIQDNYGHEEDGYNGALYYYYINEDKVVEQPYKFLYTPYKYIDPISEDLYTVCTKEYGWDKSNPYYLYNWTKQEIKENISKGLNVDPSMYLYTDNLLGVIYRESDDTYTRIYEIESYFPFKVSNEIYDTLKDRWIFKINKMNTDYYIMLDIGDIILYEISTKKIKDSLRNHYNTEEVFFRVDNAIYIDNYCYTINEYEKDVVLKINLEDFSIKRIR